MPLFARVPKAEFDTTTTTTTIIIIINNAQHTPSHDDDDDDDVSCIIHSFTKEHARK